MSGVFASSIDEMARCFGVNRRTIHDWASGGMPLEKTADGYPVAPCVKWREKWHESRLQERSRDPEMYDGGGDSPALEEYRKWRAERERMTVESMRKEIVRMDEISGPLNELAGLLRGLGDRFQKRFGAECLDMLNETLDDFDRKLAEEFQDQESSIDCQ